MPTWKSLLAWLDLTRDLLRLNFVNLFEPMRQVNIFLSWLDLRSGCLLRRGFRSDDHWNDLFRLNVVNLLEPKGQAKIFFLSWLDLRSGCWPKNRRHDSRPSVRVDRGLSLEEETFELAEHVLASLFPGLIFVDVIDDHLVFLSFLFEFNFCRFLSELQS